jgi:hypothetical protein
LSGALDEIAEKMLPRLERIYKSGAAEEDVFAGGKTSHGSFPIRRIPSVPITTNMPGGWQWLMN